MRGRQGSRLGEGTELGTGPSQEWGLREGRVDDAAVLGSAAGALLASLGIRGRRGYAYIREQLGDDLAAAMSQDELDAHIATARAMTTDDVRRFILERL